ncbi:YrbL family protein [Oxalobacter paraformigenes]|nr:YrbL family protein [Oxalobacter paraformigenes]
MGLPMKCAIEELMPFQIGKGSERLCFRSPGNPGNVIKVSPVSNAKQTIREIRYFQYLERQDVPFTHIPKFKGIIELEGYIGFEQELILDKEGNPAPSLGDFMGSIRWPGFPSSLKGNKEGLFKDLFDYLYRFNIVVCDLVLSNILVDDRSDRPKLVLVDGLGCNEFLPVAQYLPFMGRKKIARKWNRFMKRNRLVDGKSGTDRGFCVS